MLCQPNHTRIILLGFPEIKCSTQYDTLEGNSAPLQRLAEFFHLTNEFPKVGEQPLGAIQATIRRKQYEAEEVSMTVNNLRKRVARIIVNEKLYPKSYFAHSFIQII